MKPVSALIKSNRHIRVIGFDDAPFSHRAGSSVHVAGVVCSDTRMEGMLWTEVTKDGNDATHALINALTNSKFLPQLHGLLLDGIAFGGFNIVDINMLYQATKVPCITVMRKQPDFAAITAALRNFPDFDARLKLIEKAGQVHHHANALTGAEFYYQTAGCSPEEAAMLLEQVTDTGNVPEALRLAHLIGAAVKTGQSSNRA